MTPIRPVDASMTLLTEVMKRPLDPGYAAAAAAKRSGTSGHRRPPALVATVVLAALCGAVSAVAVHQLRTPEPEAVRARQTVEQEIERRQAAADQLQSSNEQVRAWIAEQQAVALANGEGGDLARLSRDQGALTGELAVSGPGLVVTVDDAIGVGDPAAGDPRSGSLLDQGRVQDLDLQIVVNGLWEAGAEALAINGERLTALSAIRSAGEAILVGFRPLSPPYVIQVIGDPKTLQRNFAADMGGQYLQTLASNFGIRAVIEAKDSHTLPAAGSLILHYAHAPEPSVTSSATPPAEGSTPGTVAPDPGNPEVSK
jgi:uncharacterized protein YlxW (UPF0749 family)